MYRTLSEEIGGRGKATSGPSPPSTGVIVMWRPYYAD
jgi:hypothetical protein